MLTVKRCLLGGGLVLGGGGAYYVYDRYSVRYEKAQKTPNPPQLNVTHKHLPQYGNTFKVAKV